MVFSLFAKKSKPKLGIDISSSAVKVLELSLHKGAYRVESYAVEPLPAGLVVEKNITDVEGLANVIQQAVKKSGSRLKNVVVAVANSAVITRTIKMDAKLNDDEMDAQIRLEADQYIPYPLDEVSIDFEVIGPSDEAPDEQVDVMLTACRSDTIQARIDALEIAGLTPKIVDVESYAMERVFALMPDTGVENQTVAIVDIGASVTTITIFLDGKVVYTREQLFGGRQLTDEVQRRYGLSNEEAGFAKKRGGLPEDYESAVLAPFREAAVQQITRSLQFFFSSSQYNHVDQILLTGGTAKLPGLCKMVQEKMATNTALMNFFSGVAVSNKVDATPLHEDASSLAIAFGLALRSFE